MDGNNPYAPPASWDLDGDQLGKGSDDAWRDGKLLMVRKGSVLPDRCLKCNATAGGYQFKRDLSWHNPLWSLLLIASPILYVLVYFIVRRRGSVTVGLCPLHRARRSRAIAISWSTAVLGIGSIIAGLAVLESRTPIALGIAPANATPFLIVAGLFLLFGSLIGGMLGSRVLVPKRIDKTFIWLTNVSPEYLATFPTLMG